MINRKRGEWSLTAFTMALEFACGASLAATACDFWDSGTAANAIRPLGIAVFPLAAAAIAASMFHLGRPFSAWRSFANLRQSPLSVEVLIMMVFAGLAMIYSFLWLTGREDLRTVLGLLTTFLGIASVVSSAMIYRVPVQPFWDSGWVLSSFLGASLLFGGVAPAGLIRGTGQPALGRFFIVMTGAGSAILLLSAAWMLQHILKTVQRINANATESTASPLSGPAWLWLHGFVLFAGVLPLAFAFWSWAGAGGQAVSAAGDPVWLPVFALSACGIAFGRALMYSLVDAFSR